MMKLVLLLNFLLLSTNHPMMMIMIIISMTIFLMIMMVTITKTSWLALFTLLMMLGGLMILFIYIASISESDKMFNLNFILFLPLVIFMSQHTFVKEMYSQTSNLTQLFISMSSWITILMMTILLMNLYLSLKFINKMNMSLLLK